MKCPKCGSEDVLVQSVQTGSVSSGKIGVQESKKQKGCLYWCCGGWVFDPTNEPPSEPPNGLPDEPPSELPDGPQNKNVRI